MPDRIGRLTNLKPIPDRAERPVLLNRRRRQDDGVPRLLAVDEEAVFETALHASLVCLDRDSSKLGVTLVYIPKVSSAYDIIVVSEAVHT